MPNLLVGIAGPTCSGKSTLEANLQKELGDEMAILPFDDLFIGPEALANNPAIDNEDPEAYRWEDYLRHLEDLRSNKQICMTANSRESRQAGIEERVITPRPIILAAGFLALHSPKVNSLFDATIFIDLSDSEIMRRRLQRGLSDDPLESPDYIKGRILPATKRYVMPQREVADYTLNGMDRPQTLTAKVLEIINQHRPSTSASDI
jgi:uridine kinase